MLASPRPGMAAENDATMPAPLYLTEGDVARLVTIDDAIAALDGAFAAWRDAGTANLPRQRGKLPAGTFNVMSAVYGRAGLFGLKAYFGGRSGTRFHVLLYSDREERLLAIIEAHLLGQLRTGAASGLATRLLARPDAARLGIIGTGSQALAQVLAVCAVRPITAIRVYGRDAARRDAFVRTVGDRTGIATEPAASAQACVGDAGVVVTITKATEPVLRAEWLAAGAHVNAAGANAAGRRELDAEVVLRAAVRATDDRQQAQQEAAEFRDLVAQGRLRWDDIVELGDLVAGTARGRAAPTDLTLFKSLGIALEDIAFAERIYRRAVAEGAGRPL